jgi:hypothetical protein
METEKLIDEIINLPFVHQPGEGIGHRFDDPATNDKDNNGPY